MAKPNQSTVQKKTVLKKLDESINLDDIDIRGLYRLADRAERVVRRAKLNKEQDDAPGRQ